MKFSKLRVLQSLTYALKAYSPVTEPWTILRVIASGREQTPFTLVAWDLSEKKQSSSIYCQGLTTVVIVFRSISWFTVSKAFEKSIITQCTYLLDSSKRPTVSVRQIRAKVMLPVILYANWSRRHSLELLEGNNHA